MRIVWSTAAWADLDRLHAFLARHDPEVADAVLDRLAGAPASLLQFPSRGSRLSAFNPRDVREYRVGRYLLRYELATEAIFILRFFHAREGRLKPD